MCVFTYYHVEKLVKVDAVFALWICLENHLRCFFFCDRFIVHSECVYYVFFCDETCVVLKWCYFLREFVMYDVEKFENSPEQFFVVVKLSVHCCY